MAYDPNVLQQATRRLEEQRREREQRTEQRRAQIYARQPRLAQIDRELRITMTGVITAALRKGEDPAPALAALRAKNLDLQDERNLLLGTMGLAPSDLDDIPSCPLCGDSGWKGTTMCQCLQELCTREQIRALSNLLNLGEQTFDAFRMDYYSTQPWPGYGISPRENMELIFNTCHHYALNFGRFQLRNLFLSGTPGLGKTFLSACIARVVSERGHSVVYDTAGNIFTRFEDQKFNRDPEAKDETRRYLNCDLLIIDDLGNELVTPLNQSSLYTVINTRLTGNKHTIISSNLSMDEVSHRYSPQISSRLSGEYRVLNFFGDDIRKLKRDMM